MGVKAALSKPFARFITKGIKKWSSNPIRTQQKVFDNLINKAKNTAFGKDHGFNTISSYSDFKKAVPIRDYEELASYVLRVKKGEENVLWPGKPIYLCKTSGTTSGQNIFRLQNNPCQIIFIRLEMLYWHTLMEAMRLVLWMVK